MQPHEAVDVRECQWSRYHMRCIFASEMGLQLAPLEAVAAAVVEEMLMNIHNDLDIHVLLTCFHLHFLCTQCR